MNKKMTAQNIVLAPNRSTALFVETDKNGKQLPNTASVAVSFANSKDAANFEQGKAYQIQISAAK